MRLGLYIFAALVLIMIVGGLAYSVNPEYYRVEMVNISLPVAAWIVMPMLLLFLFTLGHMFFYGLKNYFLLKRWHKDTNTLEDALYWSLVNEPKEQSYTIDEVGNAAVLLGKASIDVSDDVAGLTPRLARVVNIIRKIKSGQYIDLKEEKMSKVFKPGNPILIQNRLNCLESDDEFVEGVMKATNDYSEVVQKEALQIFAQKVDFIKARKYAKVYDVPNFLAMLERITPHDKLGLTIDILAEFVEALKLKCEDYIKVAIITKKYFRPEENLNLFRNYQKEDEKAQNAYLYLLFEYELIEQASNYLDEQEEDEFVKFRALNTLKKEHSKYKLEDIMDVDSICSETKFY
ncbi:hypothetical protein [Sulfurovum sp.]|uniref:hypothetical protein n=1 Tax=Sulfurovum sp. TaxID=1969726 RepID=UPI0028682C00|nr:hypothetical protein [Sulfurovum sp.]